MTPFPPLYSQQEIDRMSRRPTVIPYVLASAFTLGAVLAFPSSPIPQPEIDAMSRRPHMLKVAFWGTVATYCAMIAAAVWWWL